MLFYAFKMAVTIAFIREKKQFKFKIIEISKKNLGDKNIIALKQQLVGIILCIFMHLKWP